ncbi:hypothetical protein HK105_201056 [Polyrhizophydium stewartii]|uniref:Ankyrin repeat protein n=1 Tax=Polyrhizophydium stewartii TaxID=2732419 RepID=A0ABR4NIX5_9FUNG|nr:hypothetical protein HK105_002714 [Polyrhizophydium stewartii]
MTAEPLDTPLPPGRSHWDRLPRELRGMVLERASLLTQFSSGWLARADLCGLSHLERRQLWLDVIETDWQGDLRALPLPHERSDAFLAIRTRDMYSRVCRVLSEHGRLSSAKWRQRVAIRNRWPDIVDRLFDMPEAIMLMAASEGALWLIEDMLTKYTRNFIFFCSEWVARHAAAAGQPDMVVFAHERLPREPWNPDILYKAAATGNLDLVQWICENRKEIPIPTNTIDAAAGSGNLDLVVWLHMVRKDTCSVQAMNVAASRGFIHIVRWLADNRTEGCSPSAIKLIAQTSHLDVLEFLFERYPGVFVGLDSDVFHWAVDPRIASWALDHGFVVDPAAMLSKFVECGNTACARWAHGVFGLPVSNDQLATACELNQAGMVRWILSTATATLTPAAINAMVDKCSTRTLAVAIVHDSNCVRAAVERAVLKENIDMLEWLDRRYAGSIGQAELVLAASKGRATAVHFILDKVRSVQWDLASARPKSTSRKYRGVTYLIDTYAARDV